MERTALGAPGLGRVLVVLALAHGALLGAVVLLGAGDDETRRLLSNASFLVWSVVFAGTAVRAWRARTVASDAAGRSSRRPRSR